MDELNMTLGNKNGKINLFQNRDTMVEEQIDLV